MKKCGQILKRLSLFGALILVLACSSEEASQSINFNYSIPDLPEVYIACEVDEECVVTRRGCCGVCPGLASQIAIHADYEDEHLADLDCQEEQLCPAIGCLGPRYDGHAACEDSVCVLVADSVTELE